MLIGTYINTLDPKNRVFVPANFRAELGSRFVITRGQDRPSMVIYPMEKWQAVSSAIRALANSKKENRTLWRYYCESAVECEMDGQGRILIPQLLKDEAGFTKDVMFIGMDDKVELWAPEKKPVCDPDDIEAMMEKLDISL